MSPFSPVNLPRTPNYLPTYGEKIQSQVKKLLTECDAKNLLQTPKEKLMYAKVLDCPFAEARNWHDFTITLSSEYELQLDKIMEKSLKKLKKTEKKEEFSAALIEQLVIRSLGVNEAKTFFSQPDWQSPHSSIRSIALDRELAKLHVPVMQSRSSPDVQAASQGNAMPDFQSTPPALSVVRPIATTATGSRSPAPTIQSDPDADSWNENEAGSTASLQDGGEETEKPTSQFQKKNGAPGRENDIELTPKPELIRSDELTRSRAPREKEKG